MLTNITTHFGFLVHILSATILCLQVLFDGNGCIRKYTDVHTIMQEFFDLRLDYYQRRKDYLEGMLAAESLKLDNQARFICEKIDGTITIGRLFFSRIL